MLSHYKLTYLILTGSSLAAESHSCLSFMLSHYYAYNLWPFPQNTYAP
uniref:Uncharacterized protein n=1 Tax=Arundo donax TaxID=35708 RepID=A0A0A9FTW0_ARUDO